MKTIKGWIPTTFLAIAIAFSPASANAGVVVNGITGEKETVPCSETVKDGVVVNGVTGVVVNGIIGVVVNGIIGVVVNGLTGVVVNGATDTPTENCGVVVNG